jgi:RNA-directed DNA polymerase
MRELRALLAALRLELAEDKTRLVEDVVANLNRFLTGWAGYFRRGNSTTQFHKLDLYTAERLARWIGMRHKARRPLAYGHWRLRQERFFGLRPLVGRVHYGVAHAAR